MANSYHILVITNRCNCVKLRKTLSRRVSVLSLKKAYPRIATLQTKFSSTGEVLIRFILCKYLNRVTSLEIENLHQVAEFEGFGASGQRHFDLRMILKQTLKVFLNTTLAEALLNSHTLFSSQLRNILKFPQKKCTFLWIWVLIIRHDSYLVCGNWDVIVS